MASCAPVARACIVRHRMFHVFPPHAMWYARLQWEVRAGHVYTFICVALCDGCNLRYQRARADCNNSCANSNVTKLPNTYYSVPEVRGSTTHHKFHLGEAARPLSRRLNQELFALRGKPGESQGALLQNAMFALSVVVCPRFGGRFLRLPTQDATVYIHMVAQSDRLPGTALLSRRPCHQCVHRLTLHSRYRAGLARLS